MKNYKNILLIIVAFFAGTLATSFVFAHGGDINLIHACYKTNTGGSFRIVGPNDNCSTNETALDWPKTSGGGNNEFICIDCFAKDMLFRLNRQNFVGINLDSAIISGSFFINEDLTGASFKHTILYGVSGTGANFTDADLTDANARANFDNANLTRANLTNATMSNASFKGTNATNANFQNVDLSYAVFENANLIGATNMNTATATGVAWVNTTCPDGTNSDNNGNTCIGHLNP